MAFSNPGGLQFPPGLRSTIGGSSTSSLTASSRPSTPSLRHHPYAGVRPSSMNQPASGSTSNSSGSHSAPTTSATSSPLPTQNTGPNHPPSHENDNFRVTTHSITFSFEIPGIRVQGGSFSLPRGMGTPSPASNNANTPTTGNQEQPNTNELPFPSGFIFGTGFPLGPMGPSMGPFGGGGTNGSSAGSRSRRTKKKWVLPEGASLRSVVEAKERAAGLRCDDISCWFGPEDDDEEEDEKVFKVRPERVFLSKPSSQVASGHGEPSCMHRFHPECLLVASRVADSQLNEAIDRGDEGASLEAACPFCRNHGVMSVAEWRHCKQLTEQL
ncbi:hypothetical protein FRC17_003358 [Serendipita sp. 399]|nr:hypothetical protein FRC17_003358 [Serendipita sp. 399]